MQSHSDITDVEERITIDTKYALKCPRLPNVPSAERKNVFLALSERLLPLTTNRLEKGSETHEAIEVSRAGHKADTTKVRAGRFISVEHKFPALDAGTFSASALFETRR